MKPHPKAEDKSQHGTGKIVGQSRNHHWGPGFETRSFPNSLVVSRSGFTYVADPISSTGRFALIRIEIESKDRKSQEL